MAPRVVAPVFCTSLVIVLIEDFLEGGFHGDATSQGADEKTRDIALCVPVLHPHSAGTAADRPQDRHTKDVAICDCEVGADNATLPRTGHGLERDYRPARGGRNQGGWRHSVSCGRRHRATWRRRF